jgi:hypothetical protein
MPVCFASFRRTLAVAALVLATPLASAAQTATPTPMLEDNGALPAGGKFHECHGYIRSISALAVKVHCIDGNASDQTFGIVPHVDAYENGKSIGVKALKPDETVHIYYTQAIGVKKAYRIYVTGTPASEATHPSH